MEEDRNGKITGKYARQCFAKEIYLWTEKKKKEICTIILIVCG